MLSLVACSQNQDWTGGKTFKSTLKFLAVPQNNANTKILSIDSTGKPGWRDASTFGISDAPSNGLNYVRNNASWVVNSGGLSDAPSDNIPYVRYNGSWVANPFPSFQDVLNVNNNALSYNGNPAFIINQGSNYSTQFSAEQILFSDGTPNNNRQAFAGFDGFMSETDNGGKKVMLTTADGLSLKTKVIGFTGALKTNTLTANRNWEVEDRDGKIAIAMTNGTANLGLGDGALDATPSTGSYNLAVGISAATALTGGSQNTAIGNYAMYASTTATGNVAVGTSALQNHTTGNYNTAVGFHALESRVGNLTGSANIGLGLQAGRAVTTGSNNILIENTTNDGISTGSFNIILDGRNKSGVTTGSGNVIIGGYDGVFPATMAETIVIGTGTGTQRFKIDSTGKAFLLGAINVGAVPTYADNTEALAGGLLAGDVYKTSVGILMITY